MTDIAFVETDANQIQQDLINQFETALGETLYPGDERRIFLLQFLQVLVGAQSIINDTGRQNLLRYARTDVLDALGEFYGDRGARLQAQKATTTLRFTLSSAISTDVTVPKGTRATPDGKLYFATTADLVIAAGQTYGDAQAESIDTGAKYNDFTPGQIKTLVDQIFYVSNVSNTVTSSGGADAESDDNYRERLRLLPESFSTAGPEGAYIFWAKTADSNVSDVAVDSPSAGVVRVVPLLLDGDIPDQAVLDSVLAALSAKDRRPLTDQVQVTAPTVVNYNITMTYYLDADLQADEAKYRKAIEGANLDCGTDSAIQQYRNWQHEKLGRAISPDQLRFYIQNAAEYTASDGRVKTAVKRVALTDPAYATIDITAVAKAGTITVTYGGLE